MPVTDILIADDHYLVAKCLSAVQETHAQREGAALVARAPCNTHVGQRLELNVKTVETPTDAAMVDSVRSAVRNHLIQP